MTIKFKSKEYDKIVKSGIDMEAENFQKQISEILSITDKEGNTYKVSNNGTTQEKYEYKLSIDAGINDFTKKLQLQWNKIYGRVNRKIIFDLIQIIRSIPFMLLIFILN